MKIRFNANYQIYGPTLENVKRKSAEREAEAKLSIGAVTNLVCQGESCDRNEQFGGFILTDEDAVAFLKGQGLPGVDLTQEKEALQALADQQVQAKFALETREGRVSFIDSLALFSHTLRLVHDRFTEEQLTE